MTKFAEEQLISIIIPVYNGERYLAQAIESVLAQTYRPIEIIIVDDGSTDESARVAQQFPMRYGFQPHSGPGTARNRGVEQARGEFLAFLDADDLWMPEKLAWQIATFAARPELDAVFGQVEQFNSPDADATAPPARFVGTTLNGLHASAMLIRRAAFMRVGLFATNWHVGDFVDWYTRAQEAELEIVILPEVVMRRRVHMSNLTIRSRDTAHFEYTQIIKAALDRRRMRQAR
ncbi:MAG: glycosyltransferase family 2 protein [Chloroflexi bacterium]|nr:glycosyltransferase family 2 protein [Chloroflexota bacterium]